MVRDALSATRGGRSRRDARRSIGSGPFRRKYSSVGDEAAVFAKGNDRRRRSRGLIRAMLFAGMMHDTALCLDEHSG